MFYAASEIVFWILLAAIIGGGIGYALSQAKLVRLNKRLSQSRADAPMERELAIAWDTIEDLNKRLQVAHETIREVNGDALTESAELDEADDDEELADDSETATEVADDDELDQIVADKMAKANKSKKAATGNGASEDNGTVGIRLSERVASASRSKSIDFTDGLEG